MLRTIAGLLILAVAVSSNAPPAHGAPPTVILSADSAAPLEKLAAKEIRRYVYLRTGDLLSIAQQRQPADARAIVVGGKDPAVAGLGPEQYVLKTSADGKTLLVAGGDPLGTLYGAYRFAELLGVRFYMHGDMLPDRRIELLLPKVDEVGKPLFDRRGIQPFHDFPEGPDWWNADAYKAILGQLVKMRMNFFGLHTYPQGGVGPEPVVWIGTAGDLAADGKVKASYPARHFSTVGGTWGYRAMKTSEYTCGAAELFDRDDYGADYMQGMTPWPKRPEDCNALFDRMGGLLDSAFAFARQLGVKTCVGTETPLVIPSAVQQRLRTAGKDPANPAVVQELYEGMFRRIQKTHPLDYYWFWTPEDWTWAPVADAQIQRTLADFRAAIAAAKTVKPPFTLATCGWVLGPPQDPSLFDNVLPKEMPMSCISRTVGNSPVEQGFLEVKGRPTWSIPWLEDDPGLIMPQLWAGRMRRDAADSLAYGCSGLMGIHWRTRILGPNVSALARAAWDQSGWNPDWKKGRRKPGAAKRPAGPEGGNVASFPNNAIAGTEDAPLYQSVRYLPTDDFYADWARAEFGPEASGPIAAIFARIDGHLPRPGDWIDGPGGLRANPAPWEKVGKQYAFVDELAALRPRIEGAGSHERFDYWLNNFRYLRGMAEVACTWARFDQAMKKAAAEKEPAARKKLAGELALPLRKTLVAQVDQVQHYLLATVTTYGELGNVTNWQQHTLPVLLTAPGQELAKLLGADLPEGALPARRYMGQPRLAIPVLRTVLAAGEPLRLTVLVLGLQPQEAGLYWRSLEKLEKQPPTVEHGVVTADGTMVWRHLFRKIPLEHVARGVYRATLPPAATQDDFEYYVSVSDGPRTLVFPPTAPTTSQTVVVLKQ
ncbi:MAG: hypothetical protein ABSG68_16015 [Thermoguttaceae bacterium]